MLNSGLRDSPIHRNKTRRREAPRKTLSSVVAPRAWGMRERDGFSTTISQGQGRHGGTAHSKGHLAHPSQSALEAEEVAKLWLQ